MKGVGMKLSKQALYSIIAGLYVAALLVSNTVGFKTVDLFGLATVTAALVVFPIVYILNDVLAEVYGYKAARRVILVGFAGNVMAVAFYAIAIAIPGSAFFQDQAAFSTVLGSAPRIVLASFTAYLIGSLANARVMTLMKAKSEDKLMARCVLSTLVGEGLDATIFSTIAFAGLMPVGTIVQMVVVYALAKTLYEVAIYPLTRTAIMWVRSLPEV